MTTISENIAIIQTRAAEMDLIIAQFRTAKTSMDAAEAAIRRMRPHSDPSKTYQERLSVVALNQMQNPSISGEPSIASLATSAWHEVA